MITELITPVRSKAQLTALKLVTKLIPSPTPNLLLGTESRLRLVEHMAHFGFKRVLLVTDDVLFGLGVIDPVSERLNALGIESVVYSGVTPDPGFSVVEEGLNMLHQNGCDAVLAIGGGSSIDAAKVMALAATNHKTPQELMGVLKARKPSLPLFVIPTTAGTGSEATIGAVIADETTHVKNLLIDPKVVPLAAALDPEIMAGMPKSVTADTGIDALTHCLESWVSDFSTPETEFHSGAGIKLVFKHLEKACENGQDYEARSAMALAANYGGLALNKTGLGYVHAIAHQLGTQYGVPHGRANAIVLPHILEVNRHSAQTRLAALARLCDLATDTDADALATDKLIQRVNALLAALPIAREVAGINERHFTTMAQAAMKEAHGTYAVPKYLNKKEIIQVLRTISEQTA
ncbi:iron-containing alcohol dehydrogenase [Marinobacter sp. S6332]|uniref:iron-containing alcohol dehydrogenase n=1 Tax=Marinobacter sp. S6332 TaxID=2926403 RepID=UPI001FF682A4|nr:iron-containing alcohol dehydrogenase [Marinobacter sp. S6332]MCK0162871.1 iron-containing alcohol dehydrogenase [Marinobacter sp. S6332]